jgi:hypothetical protein
VTHGLADTAASSRGIVSGVDCLRFERDDWQHSDTASSRQDPTASAAGQPRLLCSVCLYEITRQQYAIERQGFHIHDFTNPLGIAYRIGCFSLATGCRQQGPASLEHTWFTGYSWQISLCGNCGAHLGWLFHSAADQFHGLILGQLQAAGQQPDI